MCGRLNIIDDLFMRSLIEDLSIANPNEMRFSRFNMPTSEISIVREVGGVRRLQTANWWLLQERTFDGFKPSRFTSFNTRYDKLNQAGSAGYRPFRDSRCIILAKGFGETEKRDRETLYYDFTAQDSVLALGGLFREWQHPRTGEYLLTFSVITNPPHPDMMEYHSKASPLILPQSNEVLDAWLDPHNHRVDMFTPLLQPALRHNFLVQQIDRPSTHRSIGEPLVMNSNDNR